MVLNIECRDELGQFIECRQGDREKGWCSLVRREIRLTITLIAYGEVSAHFKEKNKGIFFIETISIERGPACRNIYQLINTRDMCD